jgi:hypothetical protein
MQPIESAFATARWQTWAGRSASGLVILFLLADAAGKLLELEPVVQASRQIGFPVGLTRSVGAIVLACAVLYAIPRTAVLGAVVLTGLLGGAVATQLRIGTPLLSHVLFGVYVGVLAWGGLWLRDTRLRALVPLR